METFQVNLELTEEQKAYRQQVIEKCKKNKHVQEFCVNHHLDEAFIEENSGQLNEWIERKEICAKCSGLDACLQPMRGMLLDATMEDFLTFVMKKCAYQKQQDELEAFIKNYLVYHGTHEMMLHEFSKMDLRNETKETIECVSALLQCKESRKGLYLCGKPGIGKTYLMTCLLNEFARMNQSVCFVNSAQLIADLKQAFNDSSSFERLMTCLKKCDVLCIDDIGGENVTPWSRDEILMPLLNERMEKGLKTLFTSNYNFLELEEHFSIDSKGNKDIIKANRLMERVKALSSEKNLKGVNRRL